jgi:hypothetical protein
MNVQDKHTLKVHLCRKEVPDETIACVDDYVDEVSGDDIVSLIKRREWKIIEEKIDDFIPTIKYPIHTLTRAGYMSKLSALHLACEQNPTYEVVDSFVNVCRGALKMRQQPGGELPLHVAATWNASLSVIGFLLAAYPDAVKQRDFLGNLPLHCACFSGANEYIITSLLGAHPQAVNAHNAQGSKPRDIVKRLSHKNKKQVIDLIDRANLELLEKERFCPELSSARKEKDIKDESDEETSGKDQVFWL